MILEFWELNQREIQLGYYMIRFRSADDIPLIYTETNGANSERIRERVVTVNGKTWNLIHQILFGF